VVIEREERYLQEIERIVGVLVAMVKGAVEAR